MIIRHNVFSRARRSTLAWIGAGILTATAGAELAVAPSAILKRKIPKTGEQLPVIGLGTYVVFDVAAQAPEAAELKRVLKLFVAGGGSVIDTSPMYGRAESRIGDFANELALRPSLFLATKVWINGQKAGIDQMQASGFACTRAAALTGAAAVSLPGGLIRKTGVVLQQGWQSRAARARVKRSDCVGVRRFGPI